MKAVLCSVKVQFTNCYSAGMDLQVAEVLEDDKHMLISKL